MSVKLIALDMDGTILNSSGLMSNLTIPAIKEANDKNITVSLATGRTLSEISIVTNNTNLIRYSICSNGACVWDLQESKVIYSNLLSTESLKKIYNVLSPYDTLMDAYVEGKAYAKKTSEERLKLFGVPTKYIELLAKGRELVESLKGFLFNRNKPIEKLNIRLSDPEQTRQVWNLLKEIPGIAVTTSGFDGIEVNNKTANKADGLINLAKYLNIPIEQTMAVGDSLNDKEMLKAAAVSVAMDNADPEIKKICKFVTASNDNNGVAEAIRKYALI